MENKKTEQQAFETYIKEEAFKRDEPTVEELTQWAWNFKINGVLQIDIVDVETDTVKVKYLGKEFKITMIDKDLLNVIFGQIENVLYTTILLGCDKMTDEERQELLFKFNRFKTLLEEQYFNGQENYNKVIESARKCFANPSDFNFQNIPNSSNPTYVFNDISADDAEHLIKEVISNNNGGNIEINFSDKK